MIIEKNKSCLMWRKNIYQNCKSQKLFNLIYKNGDVLKLQKYFLVGFFFLLFRIIELETSVAPAKLLRSKRKRCKVFVAII